MSSSRSIYLSLKGVRINVAIMEPDEDSLNSSLTLGPWGQPSHTSPPALIALHGGPDWDFSYLVPGLKPLADDVRVILPDLRGCGQSQRFPDSSAYTLDSAAEDLQNLITHLIHDDRIDPLRTWVLGFSFGGRVVMRWRTLWPEHTLAGLVLASTAARPAGNEDFGQWPEYEERSRRLGNLFRDRILLQETVLPQDTRALALDSLELDVWNKENLQAARDALYGVRFSAQWARALREGHLRDTATLDMTEELSQFYRKHPERAGSLLILHGEKDMRFPVVLARELHHGIPDSSLKIIEQAGHLAYMERPREWSGAIAEHLGIAE